MPAYRGKPPAQGALQMLLANDQCLDELRLLHRVWMISGCCTVFGNYEDIAQCLGEMRALQKVTGCADGIAKSVWMRTLKVFGCKEICTRCWIK
eukprot:1141296-Pelagomonas_calceolata.AAC.9